MTEIYRSAAGENLLREQYSRALRYWPVEHEELRVPTQEGETFVLASGPVDGPVLLLLHGSGSNSAMWMDRISGLAAHFRVYAVDMIGEPGRSAPSRPPLDSPRHAQWLDAVLDFLRLDSVSIMAMSLGGWLALDYAIRRPERVRRLALCCPGGIGRQRKGLLFKALLLSLLGTWGQRRSIIGTLGPALSRMEPAQAEAVIAQVRLVSRHFRYRTDQLPVFADDALRALSMPIQVLAGQEDVLFDSAETKRRLENTAPHAIVRLLPDVGHFVPAHPSELEFLSGAGRT